MNLNYIANKCFCIAAKSWRKRNVSRNRPTTQLQIEIESHNLHEPNILETFWYSIFVMLKHVYMYCMKYIWCSLPLKKRNDLWYLVGANRYLWCLIRANNYYLCSTGANIYLWCLMSANRYLWCSTGAAPKVCQWLSADCCEVSCHDQRSQFPHFHSRSKFILLSTSFNCALLLIIASVLVIQISQ